MAASPLPSSRGPLWSSTIGLKLVMALSGVVMVGFVVQHMAAHLQIFAGRQAYNDYAHFMYSLGGLLWVARAFLLGTIVAHVLAASALSRRNSAARPQRYAVKTHKVTTTPALSMLASGYTILAFVGYHLAHFTFNVVHTPITYYGDPADPIRDVYTGYVTDFQNPMVFGLYAAAMLGVGMHLSHATDSVLRTLGVVRGKYRKPLSKVAPIVGYGSAVGFLVPPLACLLGVVSV